MYFDTPSSALLTPETIPKPPAATASKAQWRRWARSVRAGLPASSLGERIISQIVAWETFQQAKHVLSYLPTQHEIDIEGLLDIAQTQQQFYLTRTWSHSRALSIHRADSALERHRYGYLQPRANAPRMAVEGIDMVLVPGLCFDSQGGRLGYGKGYYDRLLAVLRPDCVRVGVSASALLVPALPQDEHDMRMHYVLHENGVTRCAS